ncbi:hypothetical protein N475_23155 [Pseudoalteromonas luteoviolacea DSM 6061]|uniref:Uncharacterized protein n=1 Tax=Pseudoalteromonas luteoviolacea DSM 6061 TaxID=1365250 RepID=A0A161ZSN3_9GAMM|nr:hypothetical protein N475_23155 [Pseudoalteromonas luteoviolacea DSM 6061]
MIGYRFAKQNADYRRHHSTQLPNLKQMVFLI